MAKLAKKYIAMAKKSVPSSKWQERGLKKAWALQRAAQKGGKKKPAAKGSPKGKPKKNKPKGNPVANNNKRPKIGASIQAFKGTQPLLSPVIAVGIRDGATPAAATSLRAKANVGYAGNVIMTGANQVLDRKLAHGAALSRGSVTAWLPEGFAALRVADQVKGQDGRSAALQANRKLALTLNGYDPDTGNMDLANPDFRLYQGLKIGGGIARRLSNMGPFKRITAPAKKLLGQMGGAL